MYAYICKAHHHVCMMNQTIIACSIKVICVLDLMPTLSTCSGGRCFNGI